MRKGLNSKATSGKLAITSVALQDHIARNLLLQNLSLCDPVKTRWCRRAATETHCKRNHGTVKQKGPQQHDGEEKEYVLDPAAPPLTLAQKLGLVQSPARKLTVDEWSQVKSRSIHEGDSKQPCVICREEFRLQTQVLLSCSHVFHRACLQAFERFSGRKCCPMCRKEQYETRVIHDGARLFKERCAIRIQACWRGYVVRKWYGHMRKTVPPKDKQLRRKFFETKVTQRDTQDCPICLTTLCSARLETEAGRTLAQHHSNRRTVLLSCSHLFHQPCLEAFEAFCVEGRPTCPLCRSPYHKILV
ncbi:RING finger protein 32 isoform X2 [Oncorhynchus tshawytscha]|uniref:RING finger protein 32 isoform X2 n=1 Tax=Oncorhynchus tshawytscha TaxID=74940 RepID=UPI000D09C33B|nr:RING finger protein 32 isoform X2 [Oncorhynchus tshawytscha]